jgi:hypothetical protein
VAVVPVAGHAHGRTIKERAVGGKSPAMTKPVPTRAIFAQCLKRRTLVGSELEPSERKNLLSTKS